MLIYLVTAPDIMASTFSSGTEDIGAFTSMRKAKDEAAQYNAKLESGWKSKNDNWKYFMASVRPMMVIE